MVMPAAERASSLVRLGSCGDTVGKYRSQLSSPGVKVVMTTESADYRPPIDMPLHVSIRWS